LRCAFQGSVPYSANTKKNTSTNLEHSHTDY
jgi:hypothetical protein